MALACAASVAKASVIYSDAFNGIIGTSLNGSAPEVRPGAQTWAATNDTTYVAGGFADTISTSPRSAFLAWTPASGFVYTLQVDVRINTTAGGLANVGFFDSSLTAIRAVNSFNPEMQTPWLGLRNNGGALLRDRGTAPALGFDDKITASLFSTINSGTLSEPVWEWNTLRLVLDTTNTNWSIAGFVTTGTGPASGKPLEQVGTTHTYTGTGGLDTAVTSVGFSTIAGSGTPNIQYDNFSLTAVIPEPGTLALLGFALLFLGYLRKRG